VLLNVYLEKNCGFVNVRSYIGDLLNWWTIRWWDWWIGCGILEFSFGRQSWVMWMRGFCRVETRWNPKVVDLEVQWLEGHWVYVRGVMDHCNNRYRTASCRRLRQHQYLCESLRRCFFLVQGRRKGFSSLFADMPVGGGLQCSSWLSLLFWFLCSVPLWLIKACFFIPIPFLLDSHVLCRTGIIVTGDYA